MTTLKFNDQIAVTLKGVVVLTIGQKSIEIDTAREDVTQLFTSFLRRSRKEETEAQLVTDTLAGNWAAVIAGSGASQDDFEYPASLTALVNEQVSLGRAKGKVTPGSVEVIMSLSYGKNNVAAMRERLENITGFLLVNKKPSPVTDSDGMPVAVKYIVSPLLK